MARPRDFNPAFRHYLENNGGDEATQVYKLLTDAEGKELRGQERENALGRIGWAIRHYRASLAEQHEADLERIKQKWEREQDRNAQAESLRFQRMQARINGMTDEEAKARADELKQANTPDGAEVDLLSARLTDASDVKQLRDNARAARAWRPWEQSGEGKEHADALGDILSRPDGSVRITGSDGLPVDAPLETVADFDGAMNQETAG